MSKRVFAVLVLTLSWGLPLSASDRAPAPPAELYETPTAEGGSPTPLNEPPTGEPTPLTPDGGTPAADDPAPARNAPAPQNEPATPPSPVPTPMPLGGRGRPVPLPQQSPTSSSALTPIPHNDDPQPNSPPAAGSPAPAAAGAETQGDEATTAKGKSEDVPTEVVVERYANRMIKIERHVTQDSERNFINHGPWILYAPDGTLIAKGRFEFGRRQGEWQRLYDSKDEKIVGKTGKAFTPPFVGIAQFTDNKVHGLWKIVDSQQREIRSWEFDHGRLSGNAVTYFPNGKKQSEMTFADGTLNGAMTEWDNIGNVVKKTDYKGGRSTTPYVKKYPNGAKQHEGHYLGPKQLVKSNVDFWTGIVDIQTVRSEGKPKRHGKWIEYYEHGGKKFEGEFDEDQPMGQHLWWYPNGQKMAEGRFDAGKSHGHWTWWHDNGLKQKDGSFDHGVQSGTWVHWKSDGKVQEVQEHSLGSISPQQAKPIAGSGDPPQQAQPTEAVQTEEAPESTPPPAVHHLKPVPIPRQPIPQQRTQAPPTRYRNR